MLEHISLLERTQQLRTLYNVVAVVIPLGRSLHIEWWSVLSEDYRALANSVPTAFVCNILNL